MTAAVVLSSLPMRSRSLFWVWVVMVSAACGGRQAPITGVPFTDEDRTYFAEGIDLVNDPEALEGRWREDWARELDQRIRRTDVVAYVRIRTVRTDTDLDRRMTFRLYPEAENVLLGRLPETLILSSAQGDAGFVAIRNNEQRLLRDRFVLFLKWEQPEGAPEPTPRWHLSPASEPVTARVEYLLERRRGVERTSRARVIVHEN